MATRKTLLLADDMSSNRTFLCKLLEDDFDLLEAEDGEQAMRIIADNQDKLAAVLLDLIMPVKDGYQVLAEMRDQGYLQDIPVIVVTADNAQKSEARALELGAADLVSKPYDPYIIRLRVKNLVELYRSRRALSRQVDEMSEAMHATNDSVVNTLATITEFRSLESGQHILRIRKFAQILLEEVAQSFPEYELDEKKIAVISSAAVLHDVGKISVPDAILNKPGKLTPAEFEVMKTHTTAGCEILEGMTHVVDREYMRYAYNICRYHHERWDGRGYPDGLKGENIPICAQVVGIADVYDALTTRRVYKDAMPHEESVNMILNGECGVFNPSLLESFKRVSVQFAACAKVYADGEMATADDLHTPLPLPKGVRSGLNTQQMATIKYHTLLGYVGGIVMEVDIDHDAYHVVYDVGRILSSLRGDGSFENMILQLTRTVVHPRDRDFAWQSFTYLREGFFEEGLRRWSQKFRMRLNEKEEYAWMECTLLRLDTGDPNIHKAIVAWKKVANTPAAEKYRSQEDIAFQVDKWGACALRDMVGVVLRSRNDRWQTILEGGDRLAEYLGYTLEEFAQAFGGRFLDLILPEDRDMVLNHVNKQLSQGATVGVEYRLLGKNGRIFWMKDRANVFLDEHGVENICHALMDNSHVQESMDQLRSLKERHNILLKQIDEIAFEWDVTKDVMTFSPNYKKQLGREPADTCFSLRILDGTSGIHPDDLSFIQDLVRNVRSGQNFPNYLTADLRLMKADETYVWRRLRATVQQMENGKTECIVGTLVDIDTDRRSQADPRTRADLDALTKLWNKEAARRKIEKRLAERRSGERTALLLIDLDHFREVNRRYGRMAGDAVLLQCAALLSNFFRRGDILARVGGDEFMVMVRSVASDALLQSQCQHFIDAFISKAEKETPDARLSCSIGIAIAPGDGDTYKELFQRAIQALFTAKGQNEGQGSYAFYQPGDKEAAQKTMNDSPIESDSMPALTEQGLVFYAFNLLYQTGDPRGTMDAILQMVGRQLNVSRLFVMETSPDGKTASNTFEWCADGIASCKDSLQNFSIAQRRPGWFQRFGDNGIFLCEDVQELPPVWREDMIREGTRAMLQCAILDGKTFRGSVGADECSQDRAWTREQMDVLSTVAKLASIFLLNKVDALNQYPPENQEKQTGEPFAANLMEMLEYSSAWAYVVDPVSCEILFSNSRVQNTIPLAKPGALCYQTVVNQRRRCTNCVALTLKKGQRIREEIYHDALKTWVQRESSLIDWQGRDAVLVEFRELN